MLAGKMPAFRGFTLIELLVTLAVAIILATIAAPSFQSFMASSRYASDYNALLSGLALARSEAVKRREPVSLVLQQSSSSPWEYAVSDIDNVVLRRAESARSSIRLSADGSAVTSFTVTFDSLGKVASSGDCSDGCEVTVQGTANHCGIIDVSLYGRIGRKECP
ncbi:GspH/FimT family pseudopilin [Halomonas sp. 11-S5]|uniref:GspH/FimT family pseudopilin n=1 Tax=Halomonas sp. 11-S5 TaxID=2994064 RepID=UPI002469A1DF|nr:GspH/FimT family pseudopilin [Halomonas sp. 11-S5]